MRYLVYIVILLCFSASAQNSLNDVELKLNDSSSYSFLISGHFYGGSAKTSGYPAASILGSIDEINGSESDFIVCLGDMFMDVNVIWWTCPRLKFPMRRIILP